MQCCKKTLQAVIPFGASDILRNAILGDLNLQCTRIKATCNESQVVSLFNTPQSCTAKCPDGTPFTVTVPAGTVSATTQSSANSIAHQLACQLAQKNKVCPVYSLTLQVIPQVFNLADTVRVIVTLRSLRKNDPVINNQPINFSGIFPNYAVFGPASAPGTGGGLNTNSAGILDFTINRIGFNGNVSPQGAYGLCNYKATALSVPKTPVSNTVQLTVNVPLSTTSHLDATTLAYVIGKWVSNGGSPSTYNGNLYPRYYGSPNPPIASTTLEEGAVGLGVDPSLGSVFVNGADLILNYNLHPILGAHSVQYIKAATPITSPNGVYTLLTDPYGDAPATATLT